MLREIPKRPGNSVVMTIDLDLQRSPRTRSGARAGALVAIDPNTGYILAMASHPAFNPTFSPAESSRSAWRELIDRSRAIRWKIVSIQGIYPPGSTFKIVDSIAGLMDRTLTTSTSYNCPGGIWFGNREYRCWRKQGHGNISFHRAIVESCDVFFYDVGQHLGVDRIAAWAHALGLGKKTGIELDNEKTGTIPSTEWKQRRFHERWYPAETLSVAIGQGYVTVTPMQLAELAAEVANGGTLYKPQFVKEIDALDGTVVKTFRRSSRTRRASIRRCSLNCAARWLMWSIASDGTGTAAKIDGIIVAGKTGTAQVVKEGAGRCAPRKTALPEKYRDHGWFMAFAPVDHPKIAIACIIEHSGHGGSTAGAGRQGGDGEVFRDESAARRAEPGDRADHESRQPAAQPIDPLAD